MTKFILSTALVFTLAQSGLASETVKGAQKDYETFKVDMSKKLDAAEIKLQELKDKAKTQGNTAKEKLAVELEESKNTLRKQQEEIKYESAGGWKKMKKSLSDAAEALNTKIQNALKD